MNTKTAIALAATLAAGWQAQAQEVLVTPGYAVTIIGCEEGVVSCDGVKYIGVSRKSGNTVTLKGKTLHTLAADGVTPSRFIGYEFRKGGVTYRVTADGYLDVKRGAKVVVSEKGEWVQ